MSYNDKKGKSTLPYNLHHNSVPCTITDDVINKIRYINSQIPDVEWSGRVFFKVDHDIHHKDFAIHIIDIVPLSKDSGAFTSYELGGKDEDLDKQFMEYIMSNPDLFDSRNGQIHSHNTMSAFFSGTDDTDLIRGSREDDYYVSIIVNNNMNIVGRVISAQITEKVYKASSTFYRNSKGEKVYVETDSDEGEIIEEIDYIAYDLDIQAETEIVSDEFKAHVTRVEKRAEEKKRRKTFNKGGFNKKSSSPKGYRPYGTSSKKVPTPGKIQEFLKRIITHNEIDVNSIFLFKEIDTDDEMVASQIMFADLEECYMSTQNTNLIVQKEYNTFIEETLNYVEELMATKPMNQILIELQDILTSEIVVWNK